MREPHGLAMGLFRVFCDIGFILGPLLVGATSDTYGLQAPFYAIAGIVFAAGLFVQVSTSETLGQELE
jgi:predicted MFS family arabinose efflux permease